MYWTPERIAEKKREMVERYHEYERRQNPLRMWKMLFRKIRFYHVKHLFSDGYIILYILDEPFSFDPSTDGMRYAINEVEYAFSDDTTL